MKFLYITVFAFALISCKGNQEHDKGNTTSAESEANLSPTELGAEIFNGKGNCYTCHKPDSKSVGPSVTEIAKIYKENNGNISGFLKGNEEPIVDPDQYPVMKTNLYLTKTFTDEELKALEAYFYATLK